MQQAFNIAEIHNIDEIGIAQWQQCFSDDNPFTRFEFLQGLERTGCVGGASGWKVSHLVIKDEITHKICAIMPMYDKTHSWGEYVFDWAWAEAYARNQLDYYPKLVTSVPFIPATGQRFGFHIDVPQSARKTILIAICEYLEQKMLKHHYSSWHGLFINHDEQALWPQSIGITRKGTQFHWLNKGYKSFEDFLASMTSRKRKNINKERQMLAAQKLHYTFVTGVDATLAQWHHFIQCYQLTYQKRSGHQGYLNEAFFLGLRQSMGEVIRLLIVTDSHQQMVAAALFFVSKSHLYGRYWGTLVEVDGLHFETCYYQGIDYAINHKLSVFDAGAQGEHKVARGFEPIATYSKHLVAHSGFNEAIGHYCQQEQQNITLYMSQIAQQLPFKNKA